MHVPRVLDVVLEQTPAARALALDLVTGMDLLRLEVIKPDGVPVVAFLAGRKKVPGEAARRKGAPTWKPR